jgi:hypothetical protein
MSYVTFGRNMVSLPHSDSSLGSGAFVRRVTTSRRSDLDTVRPLYGFSERTSFSLHCPPIL